MCEQRYILLCPFCSGLYCYIRNELGIDKGPKFKTKALFEEYAY